uniref:hypothetical protein n=1 Tax=Vibrio splendidus TaxID=29497 RepID=UPI00159EBE82
TNDTNDTNDKIFDETPYDKSTLLSEEILSESNEGYSTMCEALSKIAADIYPYDIKTLYVLTERKEKRLTYQKVQSLLLEREHLLKELESHQVSTSELTPISATTTPYRGRLNSLHNLAINKITLDEKQSERVYECIDRITAINDISIAIEASNSLFKNNKLEQMIELIAKETVDCYEKVQRLIEHDDSSLESNIHYDIMLNVLNICIAGLTKYTEKKAPQIPSKTIKINNANKNIPNNNSQKNK